MALHSVNQQLSFLDGSEWVPPWWGWLRREPSRAAPCSRGEVVELPGS